MPGRGFGIPIFPLLFVSLYWRGGDIFENGTEGKLHKWKDCFVYKKIEKAEYRFFFFFGLFRATHVVYGSSQARGRIGATDTAMQDPSRVCDLNHSSQQCRILKALSEARDQTFVLMDASQIRFHCATTGTPEFQFKIIKMYMLQWEKYF